MKGLQNDNHVVLKLIMKHEDEFNALEPDHDKLRAIEDKISDVCGYAPVVGFLRSRSYASAIKWIADTYIMDWDIKPQNKVSSF